MTGLAATDCDKREGSLSCSAWYIARRLGHADRSPSWIMRQISALIANEGFPPPITLYAYPTDDPDKPPAKVIGVTLKSRWQREAVNAWFDGQASARIPPAVASSAVDRRERRTIADDKAGLLERAGSGR